jgi:hypothetical protein
MKRYFEGVIIALAVVLSSGAAYGEDTPKEFIVKGTIPAVWGTLRSVTSAGVTYNKELFFEDDKGTVRVVTLRKDLRGDDKWTVLGEGDGVPVIKRSK